MRSQPTGAVGGHGSDDGERWGALMAAAQAGDTAAYRELLTAITPYLRALASRIVGPGEVEDAVQDALLTVHVIRHTYDPSRPFKPWLVTIAKRKYVDRLRRRGRRNAREVMLEPGVTEGVVAANQDGAALDGGAVRRAVERLPSRQREAVQLLRFEELSVSEAAARSGQSEGALKVAMHRAVATLRRMLNPDPPS